MPVTTECSADPSPAATTPRGRGRHRWGWLVAVAFAACGKQTEAPGRASAAPAIDRVRELARAAALAHQRLDPDQKIAATDLTLCCEAEVLFEVWVLAYHDTRMRHGPQQPCWVDLDRGDASCSASSDVVLSEILRRRGADQPDDVWRTLTETLVSGGQLLDTGDVLTTFLGENFAPAPFAISRRPGTTELTYYVRSTNQELGREELHQVRTRITGGGDVITAALEAQEPDTAPAPTEHRTAAVEGTTPGRGYAPDAILAPLRDRTAELAICFTSRNDGMSYPRVNVQVTLDRDGRVTRFAGQSQGVTLETAACVADQIADTAFPPGEAARVYWLAVNGST